MAKPIFHHLLISLFMLFMSLKCRAIENDDRKEYIVYMGSLPDDTMYLPTANHKSLLQRVLKGSSVENSLIRSYKRSFNGFAAKLTDIERQKLSEMEEVVSVFPVSNFKPQTTNSWDFMGLHQKTKRNLTVESDIIIGVLDTGVWPESDSFSDEGFGPPPKKWKGVCKGGDNFKCNNKIIGARYYLTIFSKVATARDFDGHGTHTASIGAGNYVKNASFFGIAEGTARGGVPSARIAVYKVCDEGCNAANVLSGFDDAIADGVDIILASIGAPVLTDYDIDPLAIGAFHGLKKDILTVIPSGGDNFDAITGSITSPGPWMMSVAASSTNRRIVDKVVLGNGKTFLGNSINAFTLNGTTFPLVYGKDAAHEDCDIVSARNCYAECINKTAINGKIVLCDTRPLPNAFDHLFAGILNNDMGAEVSHVEPAPLAGLSSPDYDAVKAYFNSTKNPQGNLLKSEVIRDIADLSIPYLSGRGPNPLTSNILKPDVTAPGVEILAAFPPVVSPSTLETDQRRVKYNFAWGTSVSSSHAAGAAAYVKTFHPDWSPSAVKSSLMTTAWVMNTNQSSDGEFGYGAGHIHPVKALNPGLVYETSIDDYIKFLCGIGYSSGRVRLISGDNTTTCPKVRIESKDLNYPSFAYEELTNRSFTVEFQRRVKNVGLANSTYKVKVISNPKLDIKVVPEVLSFNCLNEEKSFNVTVKGKALVGRTILSSSIVWSDGTHSVRSPIVIFHMVFS